MRTKMIPTFPETALERVLESLEQELVEATDEEILDAADDLGMKPGMKGAAAFLGLRYSAALRSEDFADAQWMLRMLNDPRRIWLSSAALPLKPQAPATAERRPRTRPAGRKSARPRKNPGET